jgi:hypothetical protein
MKQKSLTLLTASALLAAPFFAFAQATAPAKPAAIAAPRVAAPTKPTVAAPTNSGAPTTAAGTAAKVPRANLIAAAYDEAAFKKAADAGQTVIVFFAGAGDAIWEKQALLLATILREPEFNRIPAYQADIEQAELAEKLQVKSASTILVYKGGVERLRSTRMIKADPIRKMLRLNTAL